MDLRSRWRSWRSRFAGRLLGGMLLVALPVAVLLAWLLTQESAHEITRLTEEEHAQQAAVQAGNADEWITERMDDMAVVALSVRDRLADPATPAALGEILKALQLYDGVEVTDLTGKILSTSGADVAFDPSQEAWFRDAAAGQPRFSGPIAVGGGILWPVAAPVLGADGRPVAVVLGDLKVSNLAHLFADTDVEEGGVSGVVVVDQARRLIYRSSMGDLANDQALTGAGGLQPFPQSAGVEAALTGGSGSNHYRFEGHEILAGYAPVPQAGWAVVASDRKSNALAPIDAARREAALLVVLAVALSAGFSVWFARRTTRPLRQLADAAARVGAGDLEARVEPSGAEELVVLGTSFNSMVENLQRVVTQVAAASGEVAAASAELSASSEELAATTTEQSAAVTETSATTEELARAATSIAETIDGV
ncbi:MAG TPA: cache domain-containing protein, partial [Acidimicrobiia bacterium]|nr:cache domain-containing protein [Acidimicrobiia bacterium]